VSVNDSDRRSSAEFTDVIGRLPVSLLGHKVRPHHRSDTSWRVDGRRQHGAEVWNSAVTTTAGVRRPARWVVHYCHSNERTCFAGLDLFRYFRCRVISQLIWLCAPCCPVATKRKRRIWPEIYMVTPGKNGRGMFLLHKSRVWNDQMLSHARKQSEVIN